MFIATCILKTKQAHALKNNDDILEAIGKINNNYAIYVVHHACIIEIKGCHG